MTSARASADSGHLQRTALHYELHAADSMAKHAASRSQTFVVCNWCCRHIPLLAARP